MSRLYDRIMEIQTGYDNRQGVVDRRIVESFKKNPPVVIDATNVAEYVYQNSDSVKLWAEQPFYRSPFDYVFIEAHRPKQYADVPLAWGIGIKWKQACDFFQDVDYCRLQGHVFVQGDLNSPIVMNGWYGLTLDKPHMTHTNYGGLRENKALWQFPYEPFDVADMDQIESDYFDLYLLTPLFMALTLINCKNVELEDNYPLSSLSKTHERKYRTPLTTYKTIKVNPMRTVKHYTDQDTQQLDNSQPSDAPLHIVRGHFKDFRDGKGLFGKYKNVFWWDQAVRGSIDNGAVIKDYDVQAPKEST